MGSGQTVECNRCLWSSSVGDDGVLFVVLKQGGLFICPRPCEFLTTEMVTGESEKSLHQQKWFRWYRHCWCLSCRQGGYYAWNSWRREGFLDKDFGIIPSREFCGLPWYIAPSAVRPHTLSRCLSCGRSGYLLSDMILNWVLGPICLVASVFEHRRGGKPQYWLPCPRCPEGRLHLDAYIS